MTRNWPTPDSADVGGCQLSRVEPRNESAIDTFWFRGFPPGNSKVIPKHATVGVPLHARKTNELEDHWTIGFVWRQLGKVHKNHMDCYDFAKFAINCGAPTRPVEKPSLLETPLTEGHQSYQKGCYARRGLCWKDMSCFSGIPQGFWSNWAGFHGSRISSWAIWKVQTISWIFFSSPGRTVFWSTCIQGILALASLKPFIIPGWILFASPHSW